MKITNLTQYKNNFGLYESKDGKYSGRVVWYSCRDGFKGVYQKGTQFFFFSHSGVTENIQSFITQFEDRLGLPETKRLKLEKLENSNKILVVYPSKWWNYLWVRRQLLTIILRSAALYKPSEKDSFNKALLSYEYSKRTMPAIELFLKGNTFAMKKNLSPHGWFTSFANKEKDYVSQVLVKPPKSKIDLIHNLDYSI